MTTEKTKQILISDKEQGLPYSKGLMASQVIERLQLMYETELARLGRR